MFNHLGKKITNRHYHVYNRSRIHCTVNDTKKITSTEGTNIGLKNILGIPEIDLKIKCKRFENDKFAEALANDPTYRTRTKHMEVNCHHFYQTISDNILLVESSDTIEPLLGKI